MLFNSYPFLFVFLPVVFGVYAWARCRNHFSFARIWLLLSSLLFYGCWDPANLRVLLPSIALNFLIGERLFVLCSGERRGARGLLVAAIAGNLAVLGYFKYGDFLAGSAAALFSIPFVPRGIELPLGISFFTFQQIAYHVDIFRGKADYHLRATSSTGDGRGATTYALFVAFFPHLIAGPIVHPGILVPQLRGRTRGYSPGARLAFGLSYFLIGLAKKTVIADHLADAANLLFDGARDGAMPVAWSCWLGALSYAFQIYFDFSGYSDMAIGLAQLFGFSLPLNFNSPYKSRSIAEFWRRWHMTLSRFLRDYLYIPLGGNRKGPARRTLNLLLTMGLGGLWHGAGWTFAFWGLLHGVYLCVHALWERGKERSQPLQRLSRGLFFGVVAQGLTFLAVLLGWVVFRSDGFPTAAAILRSLLFLSKGAGGGTMEPEAAAWLALAALVAFFLPNTQQWMGYGGDEAREEARAAGGWKPNLRSAILLGVLASVALTCVARPSVFIYFRF